MVFAAIVTTALSLFAPSTAKWEVLGESPMNPMEASASPMLRHAYRTEQDQDKTRVRFIIDGKRTDWKPALTMLSWTDDGESYSWLDGSSPNRELWVNGSKVDDGLLSAFVLKASPLTYVVKRENAMQLIVDGKVIHQAPELSAFLTPKGTLINQKDGAGKWTLFMGGATYPSSSTLTFDILADHRIITQANDGIRIDGKLVSGLPMNADELSIGVGSSGHHWYALQPADEDRPAGLWLDGKLVQGLPKTIKEGENLGFEVSPLLLEPIVDSDDEVTGYNLFRVVNHKAVPAFDKPVASVLDNGYVESSSGNQYAILAELDDNGTYGIIVNGSVVWKGNGSLAESVELHGINLSANGKQLAYVAELDSDRFYVFVGSQRFGPYDFVQFQPEGRPSVYFNPSGTHFAYTADADKGSLTSLYIDGKKTDVSFDREVQYGFPRWIDDRTLALMVGKAGMIYRVTVTL